MVNKKILSMLSVLICSVLLLQGCGTSTEQETDQGASQSTEQKQATEGTAEDSVSLSDWDGTWNNLGAYLNDADVQTGFETLAKKENKDVAAAKAEYIEKRKADFNAMVVNGNTITFLDNFEDKDGKEIAKAEYEFVDKHKAKHGEEELEWDVFKAKDADAKYPVLLMMPVHGEEELIHFHMRYGKDAESLLNNNDWYPTFIKPSSTKDQIIDEISE